MHDGPDDVGNEWKRRKKNRNKETTLKLYKKKNKIKKKPGIVFFKLKRTKKKEKDARIFFKKNGLWSERRIDEKHTVPCMLRLIFLDLVCSKDS